MDEHNLSEAFWEAMVHLNFPSMLSFLVWSNSPRSVHPARRQSAKMTLVWMCCANISLG